MSDKSPQIHQRLKVRVIKSSDVDGRDDAYQERRAEMQLLRLWARKYPRVIRELIEQKEIALT